MRIGIVGGLTRSGKQYHRLAQSSGHEVEFHSGEIGGHGASEIVTLIERVDLLVVVTDVNSHGAVRLARYRAQLRRLPLLLLRRFGLGRFRTLLERLDQDAAAIRDSGGFVDRMSTL